MHRILINPARLQTKNSSEGNLVLWEYSKPFLNANYKFQFFYDSKKILKKTECWYHNWITTETTPCTLERCSVSTRN